jgi:hypothetical protein
LGRAARWGGWGKRILELALRMLMVFGLGRGGLDGC